MTLESEPPVSELGPKLLHAGRDEWPSDDALSRTLAAIGAGAAVVTVAGAAGGAAAGASASTLVKGGAALVSFGSVMKWLGIGALGGTVVAGVAHQVTAPPRTALEPTAVIAAPAPPAPAEVRAHPAPVAESIPVPESVIEEPKPSVTAHPTRKDLGEPDDRGVPLAAEVALVDRARGLLAGGDAARALEELAGYEKAFADPRLEPEVAYLRMEAHLLAGNSASAKAMAERILRSFPRGPHAARARAVIEGAAREK
jgi:hypothetical protein